MKRYQFKAVLKKHPKINAAYIEFPYDVQKEFGTSGQVKVKSEFDHVKYRGSLVKMNMPCHWIGVTQAIRKKIGKNPGDTIQVIIEKDEQPRTVTIPDDLKEALYHKSELKHIFDSLSYTDQKEYVVWIESAKKSETRERRLAKLQEMLAQKIKHP